MLNVIPELYINIKWHARSWQSGLTLWVRKINILTWLWCIDTAPSTLLPLLSFHLTEGGGLPDTVICPCVQSRDTCKEQCVHPLSSSCIQQADDKCHRKHSAHLACIELLPHKASSPRSRTTEVLVRSETQTDRSSAFSKVSFPITWKSKTW